MAAKTIKTKNILFQIPRKTGVTRKWVYEKIFLKVALKNYSKFIDNVLLCMKWNKYFIL